MPDDVEGAARRLLRALNDNQAHGCEGAVVKPGELEVSARGSPEWGLSGIFRQSL